MYMVGRIEWYGNEVVVTAGKSMMVVMERSTRTSIAACCYCARNTSWGGFRGRDGTGPDGEEVVVAAGESLVEGGGIEPNKNKRHCSFSLCSNRLTGMDQRQG